MLEAILRINRHGRLATPPTIAAEGVLHLGDVYDSIAALVTAGIVVVVAPSDDSAPDAVIVSLSAPFDALTRFGVMGAGTYAPATRQ